MIRFDSMENYERRVNDARTIKNASNVDSEQAKAITAESKTVFCVCGSVCSQGYTMCNYCIDYRYPDSLTRFQSVWPIMCQFDRMV